MSDTRKILEQIQVLLRSDPPESQTALRLVKNLLIQGICARDLDTPRHMSILLLDRLVRPILAGNQEQQAQISRLIRHIRTDQTFDSESIAPYLETIVPGVAGKTAHVYASDSTPPFLPQLVREALITLGGNELKDLLAPEKTTHWEAMYLQLGSLINRERRLRSNWQREQRDLQTLLAKTTQTLAETLPLIGADASEVTRLANRLSSNATVSDFMVIREELLKAVQLFQDRAQEIDSHLRDGQEAENRFRELLRQAEWALLDTRDEKLSDSFTGLPNRFGLSAYMERAMQRDQGGRTGFTLMMIFLDEYTDIIEELGRSRANQLMRSLADRLTAEIRPQDYLARYNDETFAVLCPDISETEAVALATQWRTTLDYTRFELQDAALSVRVSFGVVRHEKGENAETLLGLAFMAAQKALEEEAERIYWVQPRRKPTPPPPARKKLFGF